MHEIETKVLEVDLAKGRENFNSRNLWAGLVSNELLKFLL